MGTAKEAWRCDECGEVHDNEDDAQDCCRPDVSEGYTCSECHAFHLAAASARDCCPVDSDDDPLKRPATFEERSRTLSLF